MPETQDHSEHSICPGLCGEYLSIGGAVAYRQLFVARIAPLERPWASLAAQLASVVNMQRHGNYPGDASAAGMVGAAFAAWLHLSPAMIIEAATHHGEYHREDGRGRTATS